MSIVTGEAFAKYLSPPYSVFCSNYIIHRFAEKCNAKHELILKKGTKDFCMSCFQQYIDPEQRFIDFSATWDGGTFRDESGTLISVDDLVLCSNCVEQAATVLGMSYQDDLKAQVQALMAENKKLRQIASKAKTQLSES